MMKRFFISFFILLQTTFLLGHGFSANTLILLADNTWQQVGSICYRVQKRNIPVASYNTISAYQTTASVIRGGRSTASCYIRFGFEERFENSQHYDELACTPTQEFLNASTQQWVQASMLKIGDGLLCANNTTKKVAYISLIKEPLDIYTIEVKHTHTFFVTHHSVLTHNMAIPLAFNIGLSLPFGASAGGAAGSFFGPATIIVGAAIGCVVGAIVKIVCDGRVPTYTVDAYNVNTFEQYVKQQPGIATFSESQVICSSNHTESQQDVITSATTTYTEYTLTDNNENEPSLSIIVQNQPKETIGCGDTTPQKPLILITPADPMPAFQDSGYSQLPDEEYKVITGSCTIIPIFTSKKGSNVFFAEEKTAEEVATIIEDLEKNAKPGEKTKGKTKPYIVDGTYDDAVKKFNELGPKNVKTISSDGSKTGFIGALADERTANVRTDSTYKTPTLEIYNPSNGKRLKFRYTRS